MCTEFPHHHPVHHIATIHSECQEKYEDGWWLVQKETTNEEGIVPGSYCHDIAANRRPSEPFIGAQTS